MGGREVNNGVKGEGEGGRSSMRERVTAIETFRPNQKFVPVKRVECTDHTFFPSDQWLSARWTCEVWVDRGG